MQRRTRLLGVATLCLATSSLLSAQHDGNRRIPVGPTNQTGRGSSAIDITSSIPTALPFLPVTGTLPPVGSPGGPSRELTPGEAEIWLRGRLLFDKPFHEADGLGAPGMNADSCRGCHQDPAIGGAGGLELNVSRFAFDNGGQGPFMNLPGGQGLSKLFPPSTPGREEYDPMTADVFEQRQTPSLFGAGFIDSIPDAVILLGQDLTDADTDGVFGVARLLTVAGAPAVGRFGWKANRPFVGDFIKGAMGGELGITSVDDGRGFAMLSDADAIPDPEFSSVEFELMHFFLQHLAAPQRGGSTDPAVAVGEQLFATIGCATCHVPELQGTDGPVALYSNLLLHNVMGPGYRGMSETDAPAGFFRTPPLWGVRRTAPYMHDGRAETLRDAIAAHAGEALGARTDFNALSVADQAALITFLLDL